MIGSCVSRDNFNSTFEAKWRQVVDFGPKIYQSSFLSIFGTPQSPPGSWFADLDDHSRAGVILEYQMRYIEDVLRWKPDVLLVDFYTDARFDVIPVGDGYVTDNRWRIARGVDYLHLSDVPRVGLGIDSEVFIAQWRGAAREFGALLAERSPTTRIVVNSARGALRWRDPDGESHDFPKSAVGEFNAKWSALEDIFLEEVQIGRAHV